MIPIIETVPIAQLASGDYLSIQVYKFIGSHPGEKAYIQANLHGAEVVGNAVIDKLIDFFRHLEDSQLTGEIWLVPMCNPFSVNQRSHQFSSGRFNPYDGADWNRIFWDYEDEVGGISAFAQSKLDLDINTVRRDYLAEIQQQFKKLRIELDSPSGVPLKKRYRYAIQSLCMDANYTIDLHSSTNQSIDYLYCFQTREHHAKYFALDCGVVLERYDGGSFSESFLKPWLALENAFKACDSPAGRRSQHAVRFNIEAWTLELGSGMDVNPDSVQKGVQGIKQYLAFKQMFDLPDWSPQDIAEQAMPLFPDRCIKSYYSHHGGIIQSRQPLGETVRAGQSIYQLLRFNQMGELPELLDVTAEQDGFIFGVSTNHAVNEGEYVLEIMETGL